MEYFDGESYEKTLKYIATYSVFSSPGDNFIQEVHKLVFDKISTPPQDENKYAKNLFWRDIPFGIRQNKLIDTLFSAQKLDDKNYFADFTPYLALKRCSRFYSDGADRDSRIKICLLFSQVRLSDLEELKMRTEFFGHISKLALYFADPFGNFILENELASLPYVSEPEEEIDAKELTDSIGYIRLKSLNPPRLPEYLAEEIKKIENSGRDKIILDLRGNHGGLEDVTIKVASLFLPAGAPLFLSRHRNDTGVWTEVRCRVVDDWPLLSSQFKGEMVVLTDHSTASAGEILVAALQTNKRALVIGQKTFGKGIGFLMGRLNTLGYKSKGVMSLSTIVVYHPVTERCWHRDPLEPDVLLDEEMISKTTMDEWEAQQDGMPYRMVDYQHFANRELNQDLRSAPGGFQRCPNLVELIPATSQWDSFINSKDLHSELLDKGRKEGFEEDLPLYLAISALDSMDSK
ncbi:MAG: hypothetical protein A3F16_04115 [Deltaproteobacteria bacterium RIFCSPHIGHO2_12_FULL_43_9]|nr:MAG: hypothetical protein A3F16_04115 [Deltaproteobacteria bacterium RIFCSPHIGHO2_12_FULL_43_9]